MRIQELPKPDFGKNHFIIADADDITLIKIEHWCAENTGDLLTKSKVRVGRITDNIAAIKFDNDIDAMAFKLRWT